MRLPGGGGPDDGHRSVGADLHRRVRLPSSRGGDRRPPARRGKRDVPRRGGAHPQGDVPARDAPAGGDRSAVSVSTSNHVHERYVHEAVYYDGASQLVEATTPLLRQALVDGEDVALVCSETNNQALMEALGGDERLLVLPRPEIYTKAVTAVAYFRDFVQERVTAGAPRVCVLGEVDFGTDGRALNEWRRYEALLNHALSPFPLWSLCGYDTGVLDEAVLTTADLTHPFLRRGGVQSPNLTQVDPAVLLRLADAADGLEVEGEPALAIPVGGDLSELHRQVRVFLGRVGLGRDLVE